MGTTLNKETYEKLIKADLETLSQLPSSLEKEHIISVLNDSVDFYYQPRAGEDQETSEKAALLADVSGCLLPSDDLQKAWDNCKTELNLKGTAGEMGVYFGMFMHGWRGRNSEGFWQ